MKTIGPIYDLIDGLRMQDLDGACGGCGKRLSVVVADPTPSAWRPGAVVCIDCGVEVTTPAFVAEASRVAPGKHVAVCQLCRYTSIPSLTRDGALGFGLTHYQLAHAS